MDLKELDLANGGIRHPWETSRADFFAAVVERQGLGVTQGLDIGAGDTWLAQQVLQRLPSGSQMTCVDSSYTPEIVARLSAGGNPVSLSREIPKDKKFDLILLLDVIEHIQDDRGFLLSLIQNQVASGGLVVISVPAYQSLFSAHDEWLEHFRRYSPGQGRALIESAGLELLEQGGLFHGLLYVRILQKLKEKLIGADKKFGVARWGGGETLTRLISGTLNLDWKSTEVLRKVGLRVPGLSWWCVCRKP